MGWTLSHEQALSPVARGIARQWAAQFGAPLPDALGLLGAHWLTAMVRARSLAAGDPDAGMKLDSIDHELATITGTTQPRWSARLRPSAPTASAPELHALDPAQVLLLCGALRQSPPRTRAAIEQLLAAAFAGHAAQWSSEMRARLCTAAIPEALRPRWRAGLGLSPPDAAAPGPHRGGIRLLAGALHGADVRAVDEEAFAPLSVPAAIDLLMSALVIRAALRETGELSRTEPTVLGVAA